MRRPLSRTDAARIVNGNIGFEHPSRLMKDMQENKNAKSAPIHPIVIHAPETSKRKQQRKFWSAGYSQLTAFLELNGEHELAPEADGHCWKYHWERKREEELPAIDSLHPERVWYA